MAELNSREQEEMLKQQLADAREGSKEQLLIRKSLERLRREIEKSSTSMTELGKRIATEKDAHSLLSKSLEDERRQLERSSKTKKQKEEEWLKLQQNTLDSMKDATEEEKKFVEATFKATATVVQSQEKQKKFGETVDKVKSIFEPFGKAASTVISGYQSSSSQIGMATAVTSAGLQLATDGLNKTGEGLKGLGAATAGSTSKLGKFGSGLATGAGYLASFFGGLSGLAQKVLPTLTTELNNYIGAFQGMSSSGALFTGGLQGMADAGKNAGLNLTQFANVIKQNQSALAASGLGVGEGAKKMGDVLSKGGDPMRKQMLNLGYSYEEQAGLVAETMAQMRQSGGPLKATDKQVADQTMKYADNLRMIATLTGDDAKGRMKAAQDAANNLAFQQKMDGMTATQKADAIAAMAVMSADEKKAFMEVAVNGRAVTTESAVLMQQVPALGAKINQSIGDFNAGVLTGQKQLETNAQYQGAIHKDLMANTGIAAAQMAGVGGVIGSAATSMGAQLQENNKYTAEAQAQAKKNLEDQKNQGDGTLQGKMNNVIVENQKALIETQNAILKSGVMDAFASAVAASTAAMTNMIKQFGGEGGGVMKGITDFFTSPAGALGLLGGAADALSLVKSLRGGPGALGGGLGSMPKPPGPGGAGGASGFFGKAAEMGKSAMSGASGLLGSARTAIGGAAAGVMGGAGVLAGKAGEAISGAAGGAASALGGGGAKAVEKVAGKEAAEIGAKAIGKSLLKKIPGISIVAGLGFGLQRALSGDFIGAAGEVASGVASTIPGVGTAASMAIDAGLAAKDAGLFDKKDEAVPAKPSDQGVGTPTSNLATQTQQFADASASQQEEISKALAKTAESNAMKDDQLVKAETKTTLTDVNLTLLAVASLMDEQLQYMRAITANTGNTVSAVS